MLFVEPFVPSFKGAMQKLAHDSGVEVVECATALDAASLARKLGPCLIVCHAAREEDALRYLAMQQLLGPSIAKKQSKVLVISSLRDPLLNKKLVAQLGAEVLPEPVNDRTLLFKIDRTLKQLPPAEPSSSKAPEPEAPAGETVEPLARVLLRWVEALKLESDCWGAVKDGVRFIGGRWLIRLYGPTPLDGSWKRTEFDGVSEAWAWVPAHPENDPFVVEQGEWIFIGRKPDFITSQGEGCWNFVGKSPSLGFYFESQCYGVKFSLAPDAPDTLLIARDSFASVRAVERTRVTETEPGMTEERGSSRSKGLAITMVAPLTLASDFWLLQGRKPRRVVNKWVISLAGPPPSIGRWQRLESESPDDGDESYWEWVPQDPENDPFIKEQGAWLFYGTCPKFVDEVWVFVSKNPLLGFFYDGENYGSKFSSSPDGSLLIARDSTSGIQALSLIEESIDKVLTQKRAEAAAEPMPELETTHTCPMTQFGKEGGEWQIVSQQGSPQRRWYVYVAVELVNQEVSDARKLPAFWYYFGPGAPKESGKDWVFRERKPQSQTDFSDLPRSVQKYLVDYYTPKQDASSGIASPPRPGLDGATSYRYELEKFGVVGGQWEMVTTEADGKMRYVYLPLGMVNQVVEDVRTLERYWTYVGAHPPKIVTEDSKRYWMFSEQRPESVEQFSSLPEDVQKFLATYRKEPATQSSRSQEVACGEPVASGRGPELLEEVEPPGPSLSVLAVAFLVSELICKRDLDRKLVGGRFCQYLSASFGGLRVELWANGGQSWFCAGASEKRAALELEEARFGSLFDQGSPALVDGFMPVLSGSGVYCVPVRMNLGGKDRLLGALIVSGEKADVVSSDYARAVGKIARGLLVTLTGLDRLAG